MVDNWSTMESFNHKFNAIDFSSDFNDSILYDIHLFGYIIKFKNISSFLMILWNQTKNNIMSNFLIQILKVRDSLYGLFFKQL